MAKKILSLGHVEEDGWPFFMCTKQAKLGDLFGAEGFFASVPHRALKRKRGPGSYPARRWDL